MNGIKNFFQSLPEKFAGLMQRLFFFIRRAVEIIVATLKFYKFLICTILYVLITLTYCPFLDDVFQRRVANDPFFFVYIAAINFLFNVFKYVRVREIKFSKFPELSDFSFKKIRASLIDLKISFVKFVIFLKNIIFIKPFSFLQNFIDFISHRFQT
jgi:hypothetical protein